jgi:hypothetical protein
LLLCNFRQFAFGSLNLVMIATASTSTRLLRGKRQSVRLERRRHERDVLLRPFLRSNRMRHQRKRQNCSNTHCMHNH